MNHFPNFLKRIFQRVVVVSFSIFAQLVVFALMISWFRGRSNFMYWVFWALSLIVVLVIVSGNTNPAYKVAWVIPILLFPVFGGLFYLLIGGNKLSSRQRKKMASINALMQEWLPQDDATAKALGATSSNAGMQAAYLLACADCPVYTNTETTYYPVGDDAFPVMLEELRKAEKYIFLEYFIIDEGVMWGEILKILQERVAAGVDVRVIYDDFGCITYLPSGYNRKLERMGIKCSVFNPFVPVMSSRLNNRDHRKFLIVDGKTAFTGGINLADEYINQKLRFGHWKDNAIRLRGDAVWSMTVMFLSMWDSMRDHNENIAYYMPPRLQTQGRGFVQPYTDSPLDEDPIGESVYLHLIAHATRSIHIMTPYLIIDYEMTRALTNAAKTGVDVVIITPHIPDKWYVHTVTRAYYEELVRGGVRVYEYTPGFIHSKVFEVDGEYATVGTINLDFRSLYLHFEDGVWMYHADCIRGVQEDFQSTIASSQVVTLAECRATKLPTRVLRSILRLLSPLM